MTNKKTITKTMTNIFREHPQRAIFETFDLWDFDQRVERTWPDQQNDKDKYKYTEKDNYNLI